MKKLFNATILIILSISYIRAGEYRGYANQMYILWQPNARAEALGRGYSTLTGNPFYAIYNPASTAFNTDLTVSFSQLKPNLFFSNKPRYNSIGVNYYDTHYGAFALNVLNFSWGEEFLSVDPTGDTIDKSIPQTNIYILNYSNKIMEDFTAGINLNYFRDDFGNKDLSAFAFDLGLLKKISISENPLSQNLLLGLSLSNILNAEVELDGQIDVLPSILRLSAAYNFVNQKNGLLPFAADLSIFAEYKDIVNAKYYTECKIGSELSLFNLVVLRGGYYYEWRNDYGYSRNAGRISELTYGFGIRIPFSEYIKTFPLEMKIDYSNLPTPIYNQDFEKAYKQYNVFSVIVNYSI